MKLSNIGATTLDPVEILNISRYGIWIAVRGHEYLLSYQDFPWFKHGTIEQILHVELLHDVHLYWPDLDVDLAIGYSEKTGKLPHSIRCFNERMFA